MTNFTAPQPFNVSLSGVREIADETAWWAGDATGVQHRTPYEIPPVEGIQPDPDFYPRRHGVISKGRIGP